MGAGGEKEGGPKQAGGVEHFERAHVGPALDPAGAEHQRQAGSGLSRC